MEPSRVSCPHLEDRSTCGIVSKLVSFETKELAQTSHSACLECQKYPPPSAEAINPVIASHLFRTTSTLLTEHKDSPELKALHSLALKNLKRDDGLSSMTGQRGGQQSPYQGPCFYLGEQVGSRNCSSCRGKVSLKEFSCHHEAHEKTIIRECMACPDYEQNLKVGTVKKWAVGVTTAPRRKPNLTEMLESLSRAGWSKPVLFAEPETDLDGIPSSIEVCQRSTTLGAWPNFFLSLSELVLRKPHADAYLMCQDDAVFTKSLRDYLESKLWPNQRLGVVSLHTPSHQADENQVGFFPADVGWSAWGAMAFVFPNAAARAFLRHPAVINHRNRGMGEGLRNVDSVVGHWCQSTQIPFYLHRPSLCEHIGETTTLWSKDSLEGRRSSADFPGEEVDIVDFMRGQRETSSVQSPKVPSTTKHIKNTDLAVILTRLDSKLIDEIEDQELEAQEKYLIQDRAETVPGGWTFIAEESALCQSRCEWLIFLKPGQILSPSFLADLNQTLSIAPRSAGFLRLSSTIMRRDAFAQLDHQSLQKSRNSQLAKLEHLGWTEVPSSARTPSLAIIFILHHDSNIISEQLEWLTGTAQIPDRSELVLINGSELSLSELQDSSRFSSIKHLSADPLLQGSTHEEKRVIQKINQTLSLIGSDFVFFASETKNLYPTILSDLLESHQRLADQNPGLVGTKIVPAHASNPMLQATDPSHDQIDQLVRKIPPDRAVALDGAMISRSLLKSYLPLRASRASDGTVLPLDSWLCRELNLDGFSQLQFLPDHHNFEVNSESANAPREGK